MKSPSPWISCALVAAAFVLAPGAAAQGALVFERTSHDFGEIDSGAEVATSFTFVNRGDRDLRITAVRPSCGCTVPYFTDSLVAPGESGEVTIGFDATGRSGRVRQSVVVIVDVGADDAVTESLAIMADVVPAALVGGVTQGGVRFDGDAVDLGTVEARTPVRHRFLMQRLGKLPLSISAGHSFPEGAVIRFPEQPVQRNDVIAVEVLLPSALIDGPFDVLIALETDDAEEPIKALRVFGIAE